MRGMKPDAGQMWAKRDEPGPGRTDAGPTRRLAATQQPGGQTTGRTGRVLAAAHPNWCEGSNNTTVGNYAAADGGCSRTRSRRGDTRLKARRWGLLAGSSISFAFVLLTSAARPKLASRTPPAPPPACSAHVYASKSPRHGQTGRPAAALRSLTNAIWNDGARVKNPRVPPQLF